MAGSNSRSPKEVPGQAPDSDGWLLDEVSVLAQLEQAYVETLRKQQPEASGALQALRRRYEAGEVTAEEYVAERHEIRRSEWGWL